LQLEVRDLAADGKVVSVTAFLFKSEPRISAMHLLAPATAVSGGVLCDLEGFGHLETVLIPVLRATGGEVTQCISHIPMDQAGAYTLLCSD
jgi:hypothetical protein